MDDEHGAPPSKTRIAAAIYLVSLCVAPFVYILWVVRDSVDAIFWDEWNSVVPFINADLHGSLTLSMLWVQHNENRMLVPNIIFLTFGRFDHYDTRSIMFLSVALYIAAYWLLIAIWRPSGRSLVRIAAVLLIGLVWFSYEDWENALWGFQFAWFLIVLLLLVALFFLSRARLSAWCVAGALVAAVLGSFCSLQGLILWPVGAFCILWRDADRRHRRVSIIAWVVAAAFSTALYFWNYDFKTEGGGGGFAIRHPVKMVQYFLTALGNVFPTNANHLGFHQIVGACILAAAAWVFYQTVRGGRGSFPLSASLIGFGICFDLSITLGRVFLGVPEALSSRYTMANLLVLVAIAIHFLGPVLSRARHKRLSPVTAMPALMVGLVLIAQVAIGDPYGWRVGHEELQVRRLTARVEVNLTRVPLAEQKAWVSEIVYPTLETVEPLLRDARADHLGAFYPPVYRYYRRLGFP